MERWLGAIALLVGCGSSPLGIGNPDLLPPSCSDGKLDGSETDVDCGGSCLPCGDGKTCLHSSDCSSGLCLNNICAAGADASVAQDMTTTPDAGSPLDMAAAWVSESSGVPGGTFFGVWGSGASDVYAVGKDANLGLGVIVHSTGNGTWGSQQVPNGTPQVNGIWGSGPSDVYALENGGTILHSTGNGVWAAQASTMSANLLAAWGSSATDVYVVPDNGTQILHSMGGGSWSPQNQPLVSAMLSVWGSGPSDVYVVGGSILHSTGNGMWATQGAFLTGNLNGVWGSGPMEIYAVVSDGQIESRRLV